MNKIPFESLQHKGVKEEPTEVRDAYILSVSMLLPELMTGCAQIYVSRRTLLGVEQVRVLHKVKLNDYGIYIRDVADGVLLSADVSCIQQNLLWIGQQSACSLDAVFVMLQHYEDLQNKLHVKETARMSTWLRKQMNDSLLNIDTYKQTIMITFGLYAQGFGEETVNIRDIAYPLYKLSVQDLQEILNNIMNEYNNLSISVVSPKRKQELSKYTIKTQDILEFGVETYSGNALIYTLMLTRTQ
jgi:hypothetical protein